jgi:acyl-CoA synthetase (AMP-forming)/AMP-acid ligase II/acyl carrier protein
MREDIQTTVTKTEDEIKQWLVENIADRLDIDPDDIDIDEPITDLGLSSREAIMLSGELEDWLGFELPPELLYEFPQIKELSEILVKGPASFTNISSSKSDVDWNSDDDWDEMEFQSVIDLFLKRTEELKEKTAFTHLIGGDLAKTLPISYEKLATRSRAIGAYLQMQQLEGERALILCPSSVNFICSFFGAILGKVIAVPAFPPQKTRGIERIEAIFKDSQSNYAFVDSTLLNKIKNNNKIKNKDFINSVNWIIIDEIPDELAAQWKQPSVNHNDLAFLQYTSGSTGNPKGVMVSHGNILHNCKTMRVSFGLKPNISTVSWLPMYHDMGLIGCILTPLNMKGRMAFMTPTDFLEKPVRWLKAITKFKSDFSPAPNFAYDLLVDKVKPEELSELDLSSWVGAGNGSEPINASTLRRFSDHFGTCGFKHQHHYPCYGMAESTLMITGIEAQTDTTILELDEQELERNNIKLSEGGQKNKVSKVSCGYNRFGVLKIVNPDTFEELPENKVGEVWFKSESVAKGYWNKPELTEQIFKARITGSDQSYFLRTGDLGFMHNGEVYITGRLKDLIIIRGRNHYPQDIEKTMQECHPALTINGGAAFSIEAKGAERLTVIQEVERTALRELNHQEVFDKIRAAIAHEHEIQVVGITLLSPGRLPRTTSGKVQRKFSKKAYFDETLVKVGEWKMPLQELEEFVRIEQFLPSLPELKELEESKRQDVIKKYLLELIARTLHIPTDKIEVNKPVINFGLDSMHAFDIKGKLESDFNVDLEVTELLGGYTIEDLSKSLSNSLLNGVENIEEVLTDVRSSANNSNSIDFENLTSDQARELLTDIDELSQEDMEKLLEILSNE